jgi:hypothetical protein
MGPRMFAVMLVSVPLGASCVLLRVIGRAKMDTRSEGCVALLLAWIISLVDVNQILRPHAV